MKVDQLAVSNGKLVGGPMEREPIDGRERQEPGASAPAPDLSRDPKASNEPANWEDFIWSDDGAYGQELLSKHWDELSPPERQWVWDRVARRAAA